MAAYVTSLAAGVLIGVIYGLIHVRSPAPPLVALAGLLGILIGEQAIAHIKTRMIGNEQKQSSIDSSMASKVQSIKEKR